MNSIDFNRIKAYLREISCDINLCTIDEIIFEESVKLNCFYCKNYNKKWTCPPRIPDLDYEKIMNEYSNKLILEYSVDFEKHNFEEARHRSTNYLHSIVLKLEKYLWEHNYPMSISFIGGSCKLCKNTCSEIDCRNRGLSRIPIEAIGVNLIKTLKRINVDIKFPVTSNLKRYGMILW